MDKVWNDICNVIYNNQHREIFSSLKIPIHLFVTQSIKIRIIYIIKYFALVFLRLFKHEIKNDLYDMIFFLPSRTASNTDNLLPVVSSSLSSGKNVLLILGEDFYDKNYLGPLPCCNKIYVDKLYGNTSIYLKLSSLITAFVLLLKIQKSFKNYLKINIAIRQNIVSLYYYIYSTLLYRHTFNYLFSKITSKCAVSTSDFWPPENQFIQLAKDHGYNTYVIQHGIISEFWYPFDAMYYFVWGELHKDQLVSYGAVAENIFVAGMPALDKNININTDYKNELLTLKNILIISQTHALLLKEKDFKKYAACLRIFNQMEEDYIVTVKLHPSEDMSFYDKYGFSKLKNFIFIKDERPLHDLIIESDLCITFFSTGGLEAIALNRALVVMNFKSWIEDMAWWPKHGGGVYIRDDEALREFLKEIFNDENYIYVLLENQKDFMNKSFSNIGNASNIIINKIMSDISTRKLIDKL